MTKPTIRQHPTDLEWRVTYRRPNWDTDTYDASRVFQTEHQARTFVAKIRAGRDGLEPPSKLEISYRRVPNWTLDTTETDHETTRNAATVPTVPNRAPT